MPDWHFSMYISLIFTFKKRGDCTDFLPTVHLTQWLAVAALGAVVALS